MVLVFVMLVLALVSSLLIQVQVGTRTSLRREEALLREVLLRAAASDGIHDALGILADDDPAIDHTNELWATPRMSVRPSGIETRTRITDQNRYFDLNNLADEAAPFKERSPGDVLMDIMTHCGHFTPISQVEALKSWVDADSEGYAESSFYAQLDPPYTAADRWLYSWRELLWVRDFDRQMFDRHRPRSVADAMRAALIDCIAVVPAPRTNPLAVNVNTADMDVLMGVFGIGQDALVRSLVFMRNRRPMASLGDLTLIADPEGPLKGALPYLDVKSRFFEIESTAVQEQHTETVRALAYRGPEGIIDVIQWVF